MDWVGMKVIFIKQISTTLSFPTICEPSYDV